MFKLNLTFAIFVSITIVVCTTAADPEYLDTCLDGFSLVDDSCVQYVEEPPQLFCADGERVPRGPCKIHLPFLERCPPNSELIAGEECVRMIEFSPTLICEDGFAQEGTECVKRLPGRLIRVCRNPDEILTDDMCVREIHETRRFHMQCPPHSTIGDEGACWSTLAETYDCTDQFAVVPKENHLVSQNEVQPYLYTHKSRELSAAEINNSNSLSNHLTVTKTAPAGTKRFMRAGGIAGSLKEQKLLNAVAAEGNNKEPRLRRNRDEVLAAKQASSKSDDTQQQTETLKKNGRTSNPASPPRVRYPSEFEVETPADMTASGPTRLTEGLSSGLSPDPCMKQRDSVLSREMPAAIVEHTRTASHQRAPQINVSTTPALFDGLAAVSQIQIVNHMCIKRSQMEPLKIMESCPPGWEDDREFCIQRQTTPATIICEETGTDHIEFCPEEILHVEPCFICPEDPNKKVSQTSICTAIESVHPFLLCPDEFHPATTANDEGCEGFIEPILECPPGLTFHGEICVGQRIQPKLHMKFS